MVEYREIDREPLGHRLIRLAYRAKIKDGFEIGVICPEGEVESHRAHYQREGQEVYIGKNTFERNGRPNPDKRVLLIRNNRPKGEK